MQLIAYVNTVYLIVTNWYFVEQWKCIQLINVQNLNIVLTKTLEQGPWSFFFNNKSGKQKRLLAIEAINTLQYVFIYFVKNAGASMHH